jgi:hypothetical protein
MHPQQIDVDAERLVAGSAVFRGARAALSAVDAAIASSSAVGGLRRARPAPGAVLIVASIVHAALVAFEPAAVAPAGRYVFAVVGALAGVLLLAIPRPR